MGPLPCQDVDLALSGSPAEPVTRWVIWLGPSDSPVFTPPVLAAVGPLQGQLQGHSNSRLSCGRVCGARRSSGPSAHGAARRTEATTVASCALENTDAGGGWLRVRVGQPGVLLLRRLGPRRDRGVAVAMFDTGQLTDVRAHVWTCSSADERAVASLL